MLVIATFPPDVRHQALFLELEREAREAGRGLWVQPVNPNPTPSEPQPTNVAAPTNVPIPASTNLPVPTNVPQPTDPANCDPAYPTVCILPPPPNLDWGKYRTGALLSYRLTRIVLMVIMMGWDVCRLWGSLVYWNSLVPEGVQV